ncbi:uncharacterized protein V1510DRAFT_410562 [Dipodascopsis tothii]|uniref:uncharacterized protein n=1 Tax=Dipodascopsis tothii TaxID=44089 RepID=UPI0034CFC60D
MSEKSQPSALSAISQTLTAPENKSVVWSVVLFAAGVAFLKSPLTELFIPQI